LDVFTPERATVTIDTCVGGSMLAVGDTWLEPAIVTQAARRVLLPFTASTTFDHPVAHVTSANGYVSM
jgi:hypothetical protein